MDAVKRGQKLRNLRKKKGLNQAQLAELADITDKTIRQMEKGRTAHPWTLPDVLAALGADESDLESEESVGTTEDEFDDETLREMLDMLRRYPSGVFIALVSWGAFMTRMSETELRHKIAHVSLYLADEGT